MKKFALFLLIAFAAGNLPAAESQWLTSLPDAQALAKKENKPVFVDFTGSDWCPGCIRMEKDVLSKPQFLDYAKTNLILVQLDYPLDKPQSPELRKTNEAIATNYKVEGFPVFMLLKPDGTVAWRQDGYLPGGPSAIIAALDKAKKS
ncbi:MAG TPA: thioredoxin family protein [Verrucomicrobiae bacterium]|jgi:protein disulfide-isomerase